MSSPLRNGFAPVLMLIFLVSLASAQTVGMHGNGISPRGVPASVTSFGFGGHPGFHGVPASVTSQGFGAGTNYRDDDDRQVLDQDYRAGLNRPREQSPASSPEPVANQPSTVLIFKDGHQQEISNYAIVGGTLYAFSEGHSKKLQLEDLDLTAT